MWAIPSLGLAWQAPCGANCTKPTFLEMPRAVPEALARAESQGWVWLWIWSQPSQRSQGPFIAGLLLDPFPGQLVLGSEAGKSSSWFPCSRTALCTEWSRKPGPLRVWEAGLKVSGSCGWPCPSLWIGKAAGPSSSGGVARPPPAVSIGFIASSAP